AGRLPRHAAITAAAAVAVGAGLARRRRLAAAGALGWLTGTGELALARLRPGPRDRAEMATMLLTSVLIPPAAVYHRAQGTLAHHRAATWPGTRGGWPPAA